jgi:hypothetical protein
LEAGDELAVLSNLETARMARAQCFTFGGFLLNDSPRAAAAWRPTVTAIRSPYPTVNFAKMSLSGIRTP